VGQSDDLPGAYQHVAMAAAGPPLTEDNAVRATAMTLLNTEAGFAVGRVRVQATLLNLSNTRASDIQYYYASRLPGEAVGGATDVTFTRSSRARSASR
jgi:hypothetical protein